MTARDGSHPRLGSVLVKLRPSNVGDPEAGWFLRDTSGRTVLDQSVKRIRQAVIVEPGPGGRLKILEQHAGFPVLGIEGGTDLQNGDALQRWSWCPWSRLASRMPLHDAGGMTTALHTGSVSSASLNNQSRSGLGGPVDRHRFS